MENPAVHGLAELETALEAPDPAHRRLKRGQRADPHPHDFAYARALDELGPAAEFRKIVEFDDKIERSAAAELNLGAD